MSTDAAETPYEDDDPQEVDVTPLDSIDEDAEEQAAAESAGAIGGPTRETAVAEPEDLPSPAQEAVVEGGGESAAQEQDDAAVRRAVEEAGDADLSPDGQGFDDPAREP